MVNDPSSIPPQGQGPEKPDQAQPAHKKNTGEFQFSKGRDWLGMHFTAKQWNQLMNIFLKNVNSYIEKTYKRAIKKMKEDWRREKEG